MLKKFLARFLYAACGVALLCSCGETAGGTGEFATVVATASAPAGPLDSDVLTWEGDQCLSAAGPTAPDDVDYTITSKPYPTTNTGQTSPIQTSSLQVTRVTLTYTPANTDTPALPPKYQTQFLSSGLTIPAPTNATGTSLTVPVRIAPQDMKLFLATGLGSQSINCNNPGAFYTYRVEASFELLEVSTNRSAVVKAPGFFLVNFADFVDQ